MNDFYKYNKDAGYVYLLNLNSLLVRVRGTYHINEDIFTYTSNTLSLGESTNIFLPIEAENIEVFVDVAYMVTFINIFNIKIPRCRPPLLLLTNGIVCSDVPLSTLSFEDNSNDSCLDNSSYCSSPCDPYCNSYCKNKLFSCDSSPIINYSFMDNINYLSSLNESFIEYYCTRYPKRKPPKPCYCQ